MSDVREVGFHDPEARYYVVEDDGDGDGNAIVRRPRDTGTVIECLRCGTKEDVRFRCRHLEAVKASTFMDYD